MSKPPLDERNAPKPSPNGEAISQLSLPPGSDWDSALLGHRELLDSLGSELGRRRSAGEHILPTDSQILRAFDLPLNQVKVLIVGQDPYPTPHHPVGLSFAVDSAVRPLPRSLNNIYQELHSDLGIPPASHGDLSFWFDQGVLLLNRVLTVEAGNPTSHANIGWEEFTLAAVEALAARDAPLVSILWGAQARKLEPQLSAGEHLHVISSAHPSPLSARRGFFGSRPFSQTNDILTSAGQVPINWRIPASKNEDATLF